MSVNVVSPSTGALSPIASRGQFIQYSVMPTPSVDILNKIIQYIGTSTSSYINGYFYKCIYDETVSPAIYRWDNVSVQAGGSGGAVDSVNGKTGVVILDAKDIGFQYNTMPTASVDYLNQIIQYTGTTNSTYTNGYFYKCTTDGSTYSWENVEVQSSGGGSDNVVEGYFNSTDNLFYEESTYTTPIVGASNVIYISLDTNLLYRYNGSIFIRVDEVDISDKADKVTSATNGDLASLDTNGNLTDSGILASNVIVKSVTAGLVKNDGTIDESTYLTSADIADKADVVSGATNGDLAGLDSNGNLTDSGILATNVVTKVANATNGNLAGLNASGELTDSGILATDVITKSSTTGLVKNDGTIDTNTYLTSADIADKADVVDGATVDDFATLDASGNLTDSGINKNIVPSNASSSNKLATANDIPDEISDLDDVEVTNPVNAQILAYNSTSGKWENQTGQAAIGGAVFKGSINFANLPATGMLNGDWYDIKDAFTTDNRFEEGAGIECTAGTDIIWVTDDSKWNILTPSGVNSFNGRVGAVVPASGDYDASDIDYNNTTSGLTATNVQDAIDEIDGTIDGILDGTTIDSFGDVETALADKANKVASATNGHLAGLDANGDLTDSGKVANDVVTKQSEGGIMASDGYRLGVASPLALTTGPTASIHLLYSDLVHGATAPPQAGVVADALAEKADLDNVIANTQLIKDTVGWSGKNKIVYPYVFSSATVSGVTVTVKSDGTMLINGTATGDAGITFHFREGYQEVGNYDTHPILLNRGNYIVSKQDTSVGLEVIDTVNNARHTILELGANQSEGSFTISNDNTQIGLVIRITNGQAINNLVFKPMIRKASILDPTYEPYFGSTAFPRSEQSKLGAKNLLRSTLPTIITYNGVTFTTNSDGSITANGTASSDVYCPVFDRTYVPDIAQGAYMLSGGVPATTNYKFYLHERNADNTDWATSYNDTTGEGVLYNRKTDVRYSVFIYIKSGTAVSNLTFYPMIRYATDSDSTYAPYSETNYQLTQNKFPRSEQAVLGAKQWFDPTKITTATKIIITNNGKNIALENSESAQYFNRFFYVDVLANTDYKLSADVAVTSGQAGFRVASEDGVTTIKEVAPINASASSEFTFNTGNRTRIRVVLFGTYETSSTCNVAYNNLLITLATDTDRTWSPYAMTNRELTNKVETLDFYLEQSVTLSTSTTTTVTFTNAKITDGAMLTFASSVWDLVPDSMTTSEGECVVVLPKADTAATIGCRLYIR